MIRGVDELSLIPGEPDERPRKYRNRPVFLDGIRFASKLEAQRYAELLLLQRAGDIAELRVHPVLRLEINGEAIARYIPDFTYTMDGKMVVEDTKSPASKTEAYRLKKRLVKALLGIDIVEVMKR